MNPSAISPTKSPPPSPIPAPCGAYSKTAWRDLPEDDLATTVTRDQWALPFLALLGYQARYNPRAFEVDGQTFAVSHRAGRSQKTRPPIHVVGARQELGRVPPSGRPRLAPHSLVQEYLNRTEHVWGIVTNGLTLRLLRDSTLVRRQAYIEFDLQAIFEEQRFHDFAALYRLLHRTRLPRGMADANECLLEKYYAQTIEQGGRVREHLRDGVEECLKLLGNGFLAHKDNEELRQKLKSKQLSPRSFTANCFASFTVSCFCSSPKTVASSAPIPSIATTTASPVCAGCSTCRPRGRITPTSG